MSENGLLEPSFADAIAAIEQAKELPASKRTHWCCSLRIIAKALDRPPESIAARWGAVALKYIHDYRPALMRGSNEDWLFPGGEGGSKDAHLFGIQITDRIQKVTGLRITLHQYRHAAAAVYLKHHPGDYETVRRFLGHRNIRTTVKFYCGLETIQATRMLGDVVRQHRKTETDPDETGDRP